MGEAPLEAFQNLFFSPSDTSQAACSAFWTRRHMRTDNVDPPSSPQTATAQRAAITEWRQQRGERLAELKLIRQPTLVVNGHRDIMVPTINSFTLSQHIPNLTVSQIWVSVVSSAAWATRERRGESGHQSPTHRCNRVRNVAFRPQRRILWAGNLRVRQIAGRAWWHDLLRGESSLARRSGIRTPQCKGWRDGGSRANPVLQNVPARPPA